MNEMVSICHVARRQLAESLRCVLDRFDESYPFINTKFHLGSGKNFDSSDPLRQPSVVYAWVQGRGLEALSAHGLWLRQPAQEGLVGRGEMLMKINRILPVVVESMEGARHLNRGRLPFMMKSSGQALTVDEDEGVKEAIIEPDRAYSLSDMFYAKGLVAAARYLKDERLRRVAVDIMDGIVDDIRKRRFLSGQVCLDPKNRVQDIPGRYSHAPRMIGIGAATLFYQCTGDEEYRELGFEFINHILRYHVADDERYRSLGVMDGDFWEFVGEGNEPWLTPAEELMSDPGHATEFVGLSLAHLRAANKSSPDLISVLTSVLKRNFSNGFTGAGIVKAYDLVKRRAMNADMPWWSLPETMRAAWLLLAHREGDCDVLEMLSECWNAFQRYFVLPECSCFSIQCIGDNRRRLDVIPAVPDADPCYHTGLSLLACLETES